MSLFPEIKTIIAKQLSIDEDEITEDAHLHFDLGADSLAIVNLGIALGEKYGIEILDDEIIEMESVGQLVELVESRITN